MTFFEQYKDKILEVAKDKRFEIYDVSNPNTLVPATLNNCRVKKDLELKRKYALKPSAELFRPSGSPELVYSQKVGAKVLETAKKVKPVVKFYNEKDTLENFVLEPNIISVKLEKNKEKEVSYMHFIDMLSKLDRLSYPENSLGQ